MIRNEIPSHPKTDPKEADYGDRFCDACGHRLPRLRARRPSHEDGGVPPPVSADAGVDSDSNLEGDA